MTAIHTPVVFIHGLWLHATSWDPWVELFRNKGYEPIAPGWPNEPQTVKAARENLDVVAGLGVQDVTDHYARIIAGLDQKPVIIGHSFGGLIAQKLAAAGLARATVAIDPTQIKGVKPLPFSQLRAGFPALSNPANKHRSVSLTPNQFRYAFANAVDEAESRQLFEAYAIPSPGRPLFEAAFANFTPHSAAAVDVHAADRGPLLLMSGQEDHTVPDVVTRATYKLYGDTPSVELRQFADKGHSLVLDHGWHGVADYALGWLARQDVRSVVGTVDGQ
ncbi:alpha/beta hydrolase [Isoptericola sp. NPDC019693]|uniref:alpha/beta hydrolase n=1 Tax=Isoptericola sp. NPDC019693 TaxID=3364009 RepID=UPI0037B4989F